MSRFDRLTTGEILLTIFLICLSLYGFGKPAMAGPPTCPTCQYWDGYTCRSINCGWGNCLSCVNNNCVVCSGLPGLTCCNGSCCETGNPSKCYQCESGGCVECGGDSAQSCCDGQCYFWGTHECCWNTWWLWAAVCENDQGCCYGVCYDEAEKKCCNDGPPGYKFYVAGINDKCCYGSPCNAANCEDCNSTTHACESKCKPENCEECDGEGHCEVCNGEPFKGCCNGECYDARGQGCCNGQIYNFETEQCCEGFVTTEVCLKTRACCPSGECCNSENCKGCNPESGTCDDLCEECQECIAGYCLPCAVLDKTCCDGWCTEPCEQHMENNCNVSNDSDCFGCPDPEEGCGSKIVYTGYHTTTCSGGCFGDCQDLNDEVCYTEYECKWVDTKFGHICSDPRGSGCSPFIGTDCAVCGQKPDGTPHYSTQAACQ